MLHVDLCNFKITQKRSNEQRVSAPTSVILLTTAGNIHSLNCLSHVTYAQMYQNVVKPLTHPS